MELKIQLQLGHDSLGIYSTPTVVVAAIPPKPFLGATVTWRSATAGSGKGQIIKFEKDYFIVTKPNGAIFFIPNTDLI